ncbi:hypothetical protein D4764_0192150 [Takifugu flavidus]|uniref:PiggyBac transposable element-derived protein domain-containing protein n=1 Tax=Takifugu flavidus TaxID=433684 RepID=A0A5C6MGH2_9TELE|nr:hypothetical protein D4764_0192150 [Takifugu flavidus]
MDGDTSELDLSDNDDDILDASYQPQPQEQSSTEDESSGDEYPIPHPTEQSRGRKRLRGEDNGSGSGAARSNTPRSSCRTRHEADGSNDGPEEPTTGPSPNPKQGQSYKGRGMRWRAAPFMPNLMDFPNEDETEHDRNGWTPLNYVEQYIDHNLIKNIADCTNAVSLSRSGDLLRTSIDEVYHFFGACILMSCLPYPKIRMNWSRSISVTPITERFTRDRFFRLRQSLKVLIDDDVPEDLRKRDKFWKVRPFVDRILQGCRSQARPESVSIDEQMIPFTGACPCRQYLPMKPNPVGIKNFVCATTDGIVLDFDLYQGSAALREQVEEPEGLGLGSLVMARLCKTLHRGTKVYCDRLFTSIQGAEQMLKKELYLTDLALANSWLLYRKDLATCGAPRKSIMQFLEFRMDVARTFLAQHHSQEEDADSPELSEGDDDSSEKQQAAQGEPECVA